MNKSSLKQQVFRLLALYVCLFPCLSLFSTVQATGLKPKAILWDLGDTLFTHNSFCVAQHIGWGTALKFYIRHPFSNSTLAKNTLWKVLAQDVTFDKLDSGALDPWGKKMPSIEIAWLDGIIHNQEMLERALYLSEIYTEYESSALKDFVQQLIRWKYSNNFAPCMSRIKPAVDLLHKVAAQRDHNGNKLHELFIISNYAPEPFHQLYTNPANKEEVFNYFPKKNIFVSGIYHDSKPRASFFRTVLQAGKLNPQDTILIDDQPENIKTAKSLGITGILWDKNNPGEAYRALEKAGVIPS